MVAWLERKPTPSSPPSSVRIPAFGSPESEYLAPGLGSIADILQLKLPEQKPEVADGDLAAWLLSEFSATSPEIGTLPDVAVRLLEMENKPDTGPAEMAELIAIDPALTIAVLRVANTVVNRATNRVTSVKEAVARLGIRQVSRIGSALAMKTLFESRNALHADDRAMAIELFIHSTTTALASSALALSMPTGKVRAEQAFLGGLLHDVGMAIGLRVLASTLGTKSARPEMTQDELYALLEEVHVEIGAAAHSAWNLPESASKVCAEHHIRDAPASEHSQVVHIVRLCSALHLLRTRPMTIARFAEVDESARFLKLGRVQLQALDTEVRRFTSLATELAS